MDCVQSFDWCINSYATPLPHFCHFLKQLRQLGQLLDRGRDGWPRLLHDASREQVAIEVIDPVRILAPQRVDAGGVRARRVRNHLELVHTVCCAPSTRRLLRREGHPSRAVAQKIDGVVDDRRRGSIRNRCR